MAKNAIQYAVVDAFAAEPFKGNPAAVCLLEEENAAATDERWMQSVAAEFNLSQTAFLVRDSSSAGDASTPRFHLRWFTPVAEVNLCGHATLASAHFLFTTVLAKHDMVEFATKSGILTAKKVPAPENTGVSGEEESGKLFIELDFPMIDRVECNSPELPSIPETLNDANIVSVHKSATTGSCLWKCTLCFGTLLGWKAGETKTDSVSRGWHRSLVSYLGKKLVMLFDLKTELRRKLA